MAARVMQSSSNEGVLEHLFNGNATARLIQFFATTRNAEYSADEFALLSEVSVKTVSRELPKLQQLGLLEQTGKLGNRNVYRVNHRSSKMSKIKELISVLENE